MKIDGRRVLLCNCERTMTLDGERIGSAVGDGDGGPCRVHQFLCRDELAQVEKALGEDDQVLIGCTQESALFSEVAEAHPNKPSVGFFNIRERAGWNETGEANAKIAALVAGAAYETRPARLRTFESDGLCLVYGSGQEALDAARTLSARLSVTLLLREAGDILLPSVIDFAIYCGRITRLEGSLGRFDLRIDDHAALRPSSRGEPVFTPGRNDVASQCSLVVDLSGGAPLLTGHGKRDGYLRADPRDPAGVMRALFEASDLVGTFEKPIYAEVDPEICAHKRSSIIGCTNCLDACPAGAVGEAGDAVAIDAGICAGCGQCAAHCPTGAIRYLYPDRADRIGWTQRVLETYRKAGGENPALLHHDERHGLELINASARFGRGLPPRVIPHGRHSATSLGHDEMIAALAAGAGRLFVLTDPEKEEETPALDAEVDLANAIAAGLAGAEAPVVRIATSDPDALEEILHTGDPTPPLTAPKRFAAVGGKREVARSAMLALADSVPEPFALPPGAPYGRIHIDTEGCTLCLSCVSICPAGALLDNPERPQVGFIEANCVQCGLCVKACPEKVITLEPRLDLSQEAMAPRILNEEEPFECVSCGKPFGTRSTIERISAQLAGKHAMFQDEKRARLIQMCEDCRIVAQAGEDGPLAAAPRPLARTTEDYLKARTAKDFLIDD